MRHIAIATVLGLGLTTLMGCDQKSETTPPVKTDSTTTVTTPTTAPATPAAPSDLPMSPTTAP